MEGPNYQDRIERNYEVAIRPNDVVALWQHLKEFFPRHGIQPIDGITSVGTVYFDNRDYDLTRYTVLNPHRRLLVRLRAYEQYGEPPKPISNYWIEIKGKGKEQWTKKRFRLSRKDLLGFLDGRDVPETVLNDKENAAEPNVTRRLYEDIQELIVTMGLKPFFLITYKRLAFQNDEVRISVDWDLNYYHVGTDVYFWDSWKYPVMDPVGRSEKTVLELKYPPGACPLWIADLEKTYRVQETGFLKFVEGMGFLFQGPLKTYREAEYFLRLIKRYGGEGRPPEQTASNWKAVNM